jgi:hypothetical protein
MGGKVAKQVSFNDFELECHSERSFFEPSEKNDVRNPLKYC